MKQKILLFVVPLLLSISACNNNKESSTDSETDTSSSETIDYSPINEEIKRSYNYFKYMTNYTTDSKGYGLTQDRFSNRTSVSMAATGFLLGSYPVFVEEGLLKRDDAKNIVSKTFDTILRMQSDASTSYGGCLAHFVDKSNGKRLGSSEISTIDTAILVSGAITASQYFEDEALIEKANTIWGNVDFTKFAIKKNGKSYISMGVDAPDSANQLSPWDWYAEQLMIYILGAGNPVESHRISSTYYKRLNLPKGSYNNIEHIYSWHGSIFTYQYSHAFFNFKLYNDYQGVNYFDNSVKASQTSYAYSQDLSARFITNSDSSWGLTACDVPATNNNGKVITTYSGELGANPRGSNPSTTDYDMVYGTIAPTGAISSMPFTPVESMRALKYYQSLPNLNDEMYGLKDSFNLSYKGQEWYDEDYIGIDKGVAVMQMYNYKNPNFICNLAMKNPYVREGFINNEFVEVK